MTHTTIIGAGWAGIAAAVAAVQRGHRVTLLEAARTAGGRARTATAPEGLALDNGQHILIGAYTATLALMRTVGVDTTHAFTRLPLDLRTPDGHGLHMPTASALPQWDVLRAIAHAQGWSWRDKASLLSAAARWQWQGFRCTPNTSVAALCHALTPHVYQQLIDPLCVSAFNSAPPHTSANVFLRVLRDALLAQRAGSDVLIARQPLGHILPDPALHWLRQHGATVQLGTRVSRITPSPANTSAPWQWHSANGHTDHSTTLILACPAWEAARLVHPLDRHWSEQANALTHAAIGTVYAWAAADDCAHLPPMQALPAVAPHPAQCVFHHPHITRTANSGTLHHLLAFVASTATMQRDALQTATLQQAAEQLNLHRLHPIHTTIEKRATFTCAPHVHRPPMHIACGLLACGDYIQGDYPATLEGAVRSGQQAAAHAATNALD